jgi:hypothetical protein
VGLIVAPIGLGRFMEGSKGLAMTYFNFLGLLLMPIVVLLATIFLDWVQRLNIQTGRKDRKKRNPT